MFLGGIGGVIEAGKDPARAGVDSSEGWGHRMIDGHVEGCGVTKGDPLLLAMMYKDLW